MIRILHLVAITILIGSAAYAYSTKYQSLYIGENLAKLKGKLQREREAIAVAKAEWALLTRPDRLQRMVDRHLDLQPMTIAQLGRMSDVPAKAGRGDEIARKLETLGVDPPATTGSVKPAASASREAGAKEKRPARRDDIADKLLSLGLGPAERPTNKRSEARPAIAGASAR